MPGGLPCMPPTHESGDRPRSRLVVMRRASRRRRRRRCPRQFPSFATPPTATRTGVCATEPRMNIRNCFPLIALASLAAGAWPAHATIATDLDEVVVTASRTATTVADALAPVEVIDHDEIVRSQARSLQELLRGRAGISMSTQGGAGKLSTLFLRGAESDHVLVLVDGVRVGSATSGLVSFQDLPVDMIDRVEIVRGPRSALYGSEAIGGVIQVFTRRDGGAFAPRATASIGSHGQAAGSVGFGGGNGTGWFGLDLAYR